VEVIAVASCKLDRLFLICGFLTFLAGCGGGGSSPTTVPVKGIVTYKGAPVPDLSVAFIPEKGMLAYGTTDSKGQFALMTNKQGDGAMVGTYKVTISFVPKEIPEMPGFPGSEKNVESPIPVKYSDPSTSGLTKTVESSAAKNNFTFELTD